MPHVLTVAAFELGHPVALVVGGEARDAAFHIDGPPEGGPYDG